MAISEFLVDNPVDNPLKGGSYPQVLPQALSFNELGVAYILKDGVVYSVLKSEVECQDT